MSVAPALPSSTLLVPGRTLLFLPSLVTALGLNEAIALQQIRYRLADERAPRSWEGKRWARGSMKTWQERDFPFWSPKTVQRTFESLERQGCIHSAQPDLARRDGTKWYTINFTALEPLAKILAGRSHGRAGAAPIGTSDGSALPPLPANDLLLAEPPLVILVELAVRVGLDEAIVMQQLRYWLADERKPPVRDGQRWVCPRDIDFFAPMTHRSLAILEKVLRRLEQAGLVQASDRYNAMPGDRTKWYTLDFEAIEQLAAGPSAALTQDQTDDLTKSKTTKCPTPGAPIDQFQSSQLAKSKPMKCPTPGTPFDHDQTDDVSNSLKGSETDSQIKPQTQQQEGGDIVVSALERSLCERGITRTVARRLCAAVAMETIIRQIDVYDWLRDQQTHPNGVTPGRLRRMIEEDWQPPREYRPALAREHEAAMRMAAAESRATHAAAAVQEVKARREAREAIIEELGLNNDDQGRWSGVVAASPVLPSPFREALFYAPTPGSTEPAVIIFADVESQTRALGSAHRATRATIAARLAALCRRPGLSVEYIDLPGLREAMNRLDDDR